MAAINNQKESVSLWQMSKVETIEEFYKRKIVTTGKTISQIIAERILQRVKILLKHSPWNVSEIACALGFTKTTDFNNFFKKHITLSPLKFRAV